MAIPEGYRLLTADDIGKVFGTDLESMVYFDENVTPTFYLTSIGSLNLTNFCKEERDYLPFDEVTVSSGIYLYGSGYIYFELAGRFYPTEADLSGVEITSFNTDYSWNNWLYVKDMEVNDPYSIKIKNKEGIKLLTKDKTIEFNDDVKVTIDESLLGGGEAEPYFKTKYTITYTGDFTLIITDGYKYAEVPKNESFVFEGGCNITLTISVSGFPNWKTVEISLKDKNGRDVSCNINGDSYGGNLYTISPRLDYYELEDYTYMEGTITLNIEDD